MYSDYPDHSQQLVYQLCFIFHELHWILQYASYRNLSWYNGFVMHIVSYPAPVETGLNVQWHTLTTTPKVFNLPWSKHRNRHKILICLSSCRIPTFTVKDNSCDNWWKCPDWQSISTVCARLFNHRHTAGKKWRLSPASLYQLFCSRDSSWWCGCIFHSVSAVYPGPWW